MGRTGEVIRYGSMGIVITLILYVILGFAPSLMVAISIADTLGEWGGTTTTIVKPDEEYDGASKSFIEFMKVAEPDNWEEEIRKFEAKQREGYTETEYVENGGWAFIIFCICFTVISAIQLVLQANIKHTWMIVISWWLLSIWPFLHWFHWFYMDDYPFPGINWMPW